MLTKKRKVKKNNLNIIVVKLWTELNERLSKFAKKKHALKNVLNNILSLNK